MKPFLILILLGNLVGPKSSADLVMTPNLKTKPKCDFVATGFDSKEDFVRFYDHLKIVAAKDDKRALSKLILYPLRVGNVNVRMIATPAEFQKNYDTIFTSKIKTAIADQKIDQVFCRDQGAMYGNGEVWVGAVNHKIGIKTINL